MRKFKTLSEYLSFKIICPFCKNPLWSKMETGLITTNGKIIGFLTRQNVLKYDYIIFNSSIISNLSDRLHMRIILSPDNKVEYKIKHFYEQKDVVSQNDFLKLFNDSHMQIMRVCQNKECHYQYFTSSLPIRLNANGIDSYVIYNESVKYNKYIIQNDFVEDKLKIYVDGSSIPPLNADLFNLNSETSDKFINRVKMIITFS